MRARRFLLLAGIAGGAALAATNAFAASPAEVGSWGQAWGEDTVPDMASPRPRAATPSVQAPPPGAPPVIASPLPAGPSAAEIGGWGNAWDDDGASAPAQVPPRTAAAPVPTPAPKPQPVAKVETVQAEVPAAPAAGKAADKQETAKPSAKNNEAEAEPTQRPVQLTADQIVHDRELGIVSAKGRVEIVQEGRTLVADQVSYNLKQDIVSASGNVTLAEPTGEVMFTDYFEVTGDLKEGVAKQIRSILADNSRMAAASAHRYGGDRTDFDMGVYTACEPCRSNPDARPLWEAKAKRITHNQAEQVIEYRDAWIELGGIPVAYTPYLSHPDPSVKRKSGFLTPTAGLSSNIGPNVTVPYFWAIDDHQDFTFSPRLLFPNTSVATSSKRDRDDVVDGDIPLMRRAVLAGEHRWQGREGESRTVASLTEDRYTGKMRGHIDARGRFDLDNVWRAGYQVERNTDDTYNLLYSYPIQADRPWLTTRPYVEGFGRRSYTRAEAFAFQGLRSLDDPANSPLVLPHISSNHIGSPDSKGGYYSFDSDLLAYQRSEGTSATRLSQSAGWQRPFIGSMGDVTTVSTSLRADAYHADEVPAEGTTNSGRILPQVAANWRMPFVRQSKSMPQVLEPMAMVAASPNGGNPSAIPNEDSIGFELDELNVFRPNRLPGLDRVEGGVRGAYGLRWYAYPTRTGWINAALAQGWRAHADSTFRPGSGFDDRLSDYLARLDFAPSSNLMFLNRARLSKENGELQRNENTLSIGSPILRADVTYLYLERNDDAENPFPRRHYLSWQVTSALTRYWSGTLGVTHDLGDKGGPLGWYSRAAYNDECFAFIADVRQNYTYDRDYLAGYTLLLNIVFKTLGDVPLNVL